MTHTPTPDIVRIATRGSKLALWQAEHVKARLQELNPSLEVELIIIKTQGDKILDVPLAKVGGKGLFVKEIEEALLDGRADLAVHSMKDVPAELPEGLVIGVIPEREDPTDTLLSVRYDGLADLPEGATVGTSSLRRQAQLMTLRPDLSIKNLRGNLDTRVNKLISGDFDAIIVATAGLRRLELTAPKSQILGPPVFLPAVAQGALGIEYRLDRPEMAELLAPLNHPDTADRVAAERGFLARLEGGCQVPIAGFSELAGETLSLTGFVADVDGSRAVCRSIMGSRAEARALGVTLAEELLRDGAAAILADLYS